MKHTILILSLLIAASISSCEKDCGHLDLYGTDADILSCRVTAGETTVYGFIGKDKILIKLPESIAIENINVSLELSEGASCQPDPSTVTDWANPVNFKVTSADGKHNREYLTFISIETGNSTDNVFTIGSQSDLDAFCLNGYTEIGGLTLRSTSPEDSIRDLSGLSGLISVKGNIEIENIAAPEISFPSLESAGSFDMQSEPAVSVLLPKLRQVAGRFRVGNDDNGWPIAMKKLTKLDITSLEHVGQSFIVYRCPELRNIKSENLKTVNEDLVTGTLESLEFIKDVKSINGAFRSSGDISSLEGFNLEKAETVSITLNTVEDLSALSSLKEVKYFGLNKGADLKSFKGIENIRGLLQIEFSGLTSVTSCEYIPFNEDMEAVILSGLTSLKDLKGLENVKRIEYLSLTSTPEIDNLDAIKDIEEIKILSLAFLPKVAHFPKMSSLKSMEGDLSIYNMDGLIDYTGFESIESVGYFKAVNLTSLESFRGMENLKNVTEGGFLVMGCPKIKDLDAFSSLEDVKMKNMGQIIDIRNNSCLEKYCGIKEVLLKYWNVPDGRGKKVKIEQNKYNPTEQQLKDGLCCPEGH